MRSSLLTAPVLARSLGVADERSSDRPRSGARILAPAPPKRAKVALILGSVRATDSIGYQLQVMGATVCAVADMKVAAAAIAQARPSVIVLSIDALRNSLFPSLLELRCEAGPDVRIAVLGPTIDPIASVVSFECGADDHLSESFSTRELVLRILRLAQWRFGKFVVAPWRPTIGPTFNVGPFSVDLERRAAFEGARKVPLIAGEMRLLCYLAEQSPSYCSRDELLARVWCQARGGRSEGRVTARLHALRRKLTIGGACVIESGTRSGIRIPLLSRVGDPAATAAVVEREVHGTSPRRPQAPPHGPRHRDGQSPNDLSNLRHATSRR